MSPRRWISGVLVLAAVAVGGQGVWLYAKAQLAQVLLHRAWQRTLEARVGDPPARPWPWADTHPVALLEVPRLDLERIVLDGSSGRTLAFGPGHVNGTPLPGGDGNSVVGGHRDTHLAFLRQLRLGDELVVERADGALRRYRVDRLEVVDRRDVAVMADTGEPRLTLVTCYPFEALVPGGPLRYVVGAALSSSLGLSPSPGLSPDPVAQAGKSDGDMPRSTMLHPVTAATPAALARRSTSGSSVPGLNHTSPAPAAAISSIISSSTAGGR